MAMRMQKLTMTLNERLDIRPVAAAVDQRALRWLGHVARMPDDNVAKMLLYARVPGWMGDRDTWRSRPEAHSK